MKRFLLMPVRFSAMLRFLRTIRIVTSEYMLRHATAACSCR